MVGGELGAALIKMAASPVKADREAIARVERECQQDVRNIARLLEHSEIVLLASETEKCSKPKIIAAGVFWAGIIGIAAMLLRPTLMWEGVGLGFIAGSAAVVKKNQGMSMDNLKDKLHESYQIYVEQPETEVNGECQKVDGRGWEDTKLPSSTSASGYVDTASGIHCTKYHECD